MFSRRIILIRWVSAIEFASTRVVILTTWIAAIEFGSTHVLILRTWFDGSEFAFTLAVILTARIAAIEFTYGALNMPLALRLDHEPDLVRRLFPGCQPPVSDELFAVKDTHDGIRVSHIEYEQHMSFLRQIVPARVRQERS